MPLGTGEGIDPGRRDGILVAGGVGSKTQHLVGGEIAHPGKDLKAAVGATDAGRQFGVARSCGSLLKGLGLGLQVAPERGRQPVEHRQETEVPKAEVIANDLGGLAPRFIADAHMSIEAGHHLGGDHCVAQVAANGVDQGLAGFILLGRLGFLFGLVGNGGVAHRSPPSTVIGSPRQRAAISSF